MSAARGYISASLVAALVALAGSVRAEPAAERRTSLHSSGAAAPAGGQATGRLRLDPVGGDREAPNLWIPVLHGALLMTGMRISEALIWPDPFAETDLSVIGERYQRAFTQPPKWDSSERAFEWDGDPWYINVVGHGLFGSELYLRARQCQLGVLGSLLFTTATSAVWEYGFEANGVRPSGLDVWYTPLSGLLLGELRYAGWKAAAGIQSGGVRSTLRAVLDPFGELERAAGTKC